MSNNKVCKFFVKGSCNHGTECKFIHDSTICKNYFLNGNCKRDDKCKFKHTQTMAKKRPKNTENFKPSHEAADLNIIVPSNNTNLSNKVFSPNDIIIIPNFLKETKENELYNNLIKEMNESGISEDNLWKLWHGDNHLIADDHLEWKEKVPTFNYIISEISKYFNMDIKSTRFNLYKNSNDWKPFHHDAAAIKDHIAKVQNFTVGISLGATRSVAFENAKNKLVIDFPLENGTIYAFSKDVNIKWKHGIPQVHPDKFFEDGRISIIAWGAVKME